MKIPGKPSIDLLFIRWIKLLIEMNLFVLLEIDLRFVRVFMIV